MKRAGEEQSEPAVKKPKLDIASLKAKLAATKAKLANLPTKTSAATGTAPQAAPGPAVAAPQPEPVPRPQAPVPVGVKPLVPPGAPATGLPAAAAAQDEAARPEHNPFFDPRMGGARGVGRRGRRKGALSFVDREKALQQAETEKLKGSKFGGQIAKGLQERDQALKALQAKEAAAGGLDPNLVPLGQRTFAPVKVKQEVPEMEWWDALVFAQPNYEPGENGLVAIKENRITELVEHPVPMEPPAEGPMPAPQPLKLTKQEQKKMRRQRREAREKEKQRLIQEGLLEPAKPKVKLSNMHRVYGAMGVLDATAIDLEIRKAAAERLAAHEDRNAARKLTTSERREKKIKKLFGEPDVDTLVQVFRVTSLSDGRHLYKVDVNAKENRLTGACITTDSGINVVVVEGCAKSIRRFNKLMLHRIDWNPPQGVDDNDEDMFGEVNKCHLVWEGSVQTPAFTEFVREKCFNEHAARQVLAKAGVVHYWDAAKNFQPEV